MSEMELKESKPLLGHKKNKEGTPVQETSGSDQSEVAGSQDQDHVTGSASSTQSSPSSENESTQGTSNSAQSGSPGTQGLDGDMAGSSVGARGGTQERGSGIWNSQMPCFNRKKCIKFLPSREELKEYETIIQLNPTYDRKNIRCRCGLAFKDHKTDESESGPPLLYDIVKGLIDEDVSVAEFTAGVFKGEDGEETKREYKWNPRDLYRRSQIDREMSLQDTKIEVPGAEMGDIEFLINDNLKTRSQFTRLSDTTEMSELKTFLKDQWKLLDPMPELMISLVGSTQNKDLADNLVKSIIKISKFMNLIILTSGLENDLVAKKIGDAVTKEQRWTTENDEQLAARSRIKCVGITSWGALNGKEKPVFKTRDSETDIYKIPKNIESHGHSSVLNPGHKYFLLVDTGTTWEQSRELNKFCAELLKKLKAELPNVLNLVLGTNKEAKYTIGMTELLVPYFPLIFLRHSGKYLDTLVDGVLQFQEDGGRDRARGENEEMASIVDKFLQNHVFQDYQQKNVMIVCDLLEGESNTLISAMVKTLTQPLIVKEDNSNSVSPTASSTATSPVNSHVSILARSLNQMSQVFANSGDQLSHAVKSRVPAEILQMDNRAIEIYKKALEEGKEPNYSIRLMVTGPYGVGKSTFTKRLLCQDVDINDKTSTDGIDVHVKKCEVSLETSSWNMDYTGENTVQRLAKVLQNVDKKNTEEESPSIENGDNDSGRFQDTDEKIEESSSKTANRACGDSAPKSTETYTNRNASNIDAKADQNMSSNMGNIVSVDDAQPSTDNTRMKHEEMLLKDLEEVVLNSGAVTSDEDHAEISVWDFGGQFVFYTTHQMFLSSRAIYILVNNMSQNIDDIVNDDETYFDCSGSKSLKIEDFLDIWLSSIHGHSDREKQGTPPVILVGTHADKLNPETREDQTEAIFDAIRNRFAGKDVSSHFIDKDFGLSNAFIDPKLDELRQTILEVAKQQPYWGEIKPAKWIHLERLLEEKRREGVEILSHSEILLLNQSLPVPIVGDEELELFLRFQHETANIMYFSVPELQSKIVLSPKFLVNALKSLITAEMFYKKKAELLDKLNEFRRKGILKISLIDAVWNREENQQFRESREHILALMEHLNIIARPVLHSEDDKPHDRDNDYYLVPCMLKGPPPESILNVECQFISTPSVCLVLENAAFPSAIFNRLLVGCIARWPVAKREKKFQIYCGCGQFDVDAQHRLTLAFHANVVSLRITKFGQISRNPDVYICSTVYSSVKQILDRINKCLSLALKFEECIQCPGDTTNVVSCMHSIEKLKSCDEFPCHEHDPVAILHSSDLLKYWFNSEDSAHENDAGAVGGAPLDPSLDACGVTNADNTSMDSIESGSDDAETLEDVDETDVIATGPITQEHMNYARVCNVIVTVCANVLRDILLSQVPIGYTSIYKALLGRKTMINQMRQIGAEQFKLIFPDSRFRYTGTVDQFDITLLYALIRNISSCPAPATGWGKAPTDNPRDVTLSANVERVRLIRNRVSGHSVDGQLDEKACQDYFGEIGQILDDVEAVLGDQGYKAALEERRKQVITPHEAKVLRKQLQPLHHQLKEIVDKLLTL